MKLEFKPLQTDDDYALAEQFKRATALDVTGDATLFDTWFPATRPFEEWVAAMVAKDPTSYVLVWADGQPIGDVNVRIRDNGYGHLGNIYLKPEWRGKGLGDQLDDYALAYVKVRGATKMSLKTYPNQPKLLAFYERRGWVKTEQIGNDVWMEREIS